MWKLIKSVVAWKKSEHEKVGLIWKRKRKICKHLLLSLWATTHHHRHHHQGAKKRGKITLNCNEVNSNMEIISSCHKIFTEVIAFFSLWFFPLLCLSIARQWKTSWRRRNSFHWSTTHFIFYVALACFTCCWTWSKLQWTISEYDMCEW